MKITIAGSLGNISKPLAQTLIAEGHDVTIISSQEARRSDIEALGAKAAIGSIDDADFLTSAFSGADAVYTMTPPNLGGQNIKAHTAAAGEALAEAIRRSGVKRAVMLSSIGADQPDGNGPIGGLYAVEQRFRQLKDVAITFLRAGYFYYNSFNDIPLIKHQHIVGGNYPATTKIPLVHPKDIAAAAADFLQQKIEGHEVRYVVSDYRTSAEIAKALGTATGQPELPWVEFTDEQSLEGMKGAGVPAEIAGLYTEMGAGFRKGNIPAHFISEGAPVTGKIKLEEFAKEFAERYKLQ
jgi:uncharacterized protein YbjT (DUF2867 family)